MGSEMCIRDRYALCGEIMSSLEDDTSIDPTAAGSVEDAEREALFE